jgi:KUP system potassium uptake protein
MQQTTTGSIAADGPSAEAASRQNFWALTLGCIGVVYGDIGTSPLYAVRESVLAATSGGEAAGEPVILGILSLIVWALILIVTIKYVLILLRADNDGEGGTLALMALANRALGGKSYTIILLGIIGAGLFYGAPSSPLRFRCCRRLRVSRLSPLPWTNTSFSLAF